jgi:methylmalonyl-CoA mutase cobalamin-binding subunit
MTEAVVATFKDVKSIMNVEEDLLATGIPNEKIKIDKEHRKIRVFTPDATKAEVLEILKRHMPAEVH